MGAFEAFKDKNNLLIDIGDLTKPFDPQRVRAKLDN